MDFTPDSAPTKQCTWCKDDFPATSVFFYADKNRADNFYPHCKPCVKLIQQARAERRKEDRQTQEVKEKCCCRCGEVKAVAEFHRDSYTVDGYRPACRLCLSKSGGFRYVPLPKAGYRTCNRCGKELPATPEFFYFYAYGNHGPNAHCKKCANKAAKIYRTNREYSEERQKQVRQTEPSKTCSRCKKDYPRTPQFFHSDTEKRDGLSSTCQSCVGKRVKAWASKNRQLMRIHSAVFGHKRKTRRLALAHKFSVSDWQHALTYFKNSCAVCGRPIGLFHTLAMDHWIALSDVNCPGTIPSNIVPLCHGADGCNNQKHMKPAAEWLASKFGKRKGAAILARIEAYFASLPSHIVSP